MILPRPIRKLIESFEKLPGIGPKTAQRLTFYLLHVPQSDLDEFSESLSDLKKNTVECSICFNVAEENPCDICGDVSRDKGTICVVEQPLDILAMERSGKYHGVYHVLHGAINPLDNIGPEEIRIGELIRRIQHSSFSIQELILATDPDMEGEATAMYIAKKLGELKSSSFAKASADKQSSKLRTVRVTRLGQGLPTGADLEYADELTLTRALEGRREY